MPNQPAGIQQRIADIIDADPADGDWPREVWRAHAEALARAVVSELGLVEERQYKHPFGHGDQQEIRYVTEWSDE